MRKRIPSGMLLLVAIIALGAGIGIGYGIQVGTVNALESDIDQRDDQIAEYEFIVASLNVDKAQLQSELEAKESECSTLQDELTDAESQVSLWIKNYNTLSSYYQTCQNLSEALQYQYENLQMACQGASVEEILAMQDKIISLEGQNSWLKAQVSRLENQLTPSPDRAINPDQVWNNPKFKSTAWEGRNYQLRTKLEEIGALYYRTHTYLQGQTDCNDMAVDLWNMLLTVDIKSVIVVGNKDKQSEEFDECDHAWLYVFDAEGKVIYLEPTTGVVIYGLLPDGSSNPAADKYRDGFIYETPSDLWNDLCPTNHNW